MKGFTLIELLVVILIIAILSSIALPQYTKAVEKSRATEAIVTGKAIVEAQNRSLEAFPNSPVNQRRALDVRLDGGLWTPDTAASNTYTTQHFVYTLYSTGVIATRTGGSLEYSLYMGNNEAATANTCYGDICKNMRGAGFVNGNE